MAIAIRLATRQRLTDVGVVDFEAFVRCKGYLSTKDHLIAESLCRAILIIADSGIDRQFRLLDIGSGEASLIESVVRGLLTARPWRSEQLFINCVEPTVLGDAYCREFATRASALQVPVACHAETIECFLEQTNGPYDAVVCCHTLYHIEQQHWRGLVDGLRAALAPAGVLLINLVSRTSDIYRMLDDLEPRFTRANVERCFEAFGSLVFAEDLIPLFADDAVSVSATHISAPIRFSQTEVAACADALACGIGETSALVQFLAFMFRVRPRDLERVGNDVLTKLVASREEITFSSTDYLYSIQWRRA